LSISIDRGCGARIECWRHEDLRTGEIGTDLRPRLCAVCCLEHELIRVVKRARIRLGENERLRPVASGRLRRFRTRRAFYRNVRVEIPALTVSAVNHAWIEPITSGITALSAGSDRLPIVH